MEKIYPKPIADIEKTDKQLFEAVKNIYDFTMAPGELDTKTKMLIMIALDAYHGASEGVEILSDRARKLGATDSQIAETLRVAYLTKGMGTLVASRFAYR
jgi:alkylhydroperoxidase/carboxymuconolactone decarboxylase family protein YurZ